MLDQLWEVVTLVVVIAAVAATAVVGFVRGRAGRTKELPPTTPGASVESRPAAADVEDRDDGGSVTTASIEPLARFVAIALLRNTNGFPSGSVWSRPVCSP